jgi:nucleoside-diphosphate-sugar epimerase
MIAQNSSWRGRRALVTGVTGFLGSAVARELLARGADVVGLVHQRPATGLFDSVQSEHVCFVRGRGDNVFRLHSAMAVHEVAAVFHFADCDSSALMQAIHRYSARVPIVTARPIPHLAIARTEEPHEERLSVVRFGAVFGPGDWKLSRVVPATAREVLRGDLVTPTDGPARDFVFVRDAARACLLAAEPANAGPGEYTFRSGWQMTDRQMAAAVREAAASRAIEVPDSAPLSNPLGWEPSQSLTDALNETLVWYHTFFRTGNADSIRAAA